MGCITHVPTHVIQRVEDMAESQNQPLMRDGRLNFEWRPGVPFGDNYDEGGHVEDGIVNEEVEEDNEDQGEAQEMFYEQHDHNENMNMDTAALEVMPMHLENESEDEGSVVVEMRHSVMANFKSN